MSTCYPKTGSVKIADGETLTLVSNYSSNQMHAGVMGLFYILVADNEEGPVLTPPRNMMCFNSLISCNLLLLSLINTHIHTHTHTHTHTHKHRQTLPHIL
jgi:Stress up-regulated Nod 19